MTAKLLHISACSIDGCDKPHLARGWCKNHYERWRRRGDPEDRPSKKESFIGEVVLSHEGDECLIWPFSRSKKGYGNYATVGGRRDYPHRLICTLVHGEPPTAQHHAAHSCGNGHLGCVTKGHISWKTPKANNADKVIHGTETVGESNSRAKLTERDIAAIRNLASQFPKGKFPRTEVAARFNVSVSAIGRIITGDQWGHL